MTPTPLLYKRVWLDPTPLYIGNTPRKGTQTPCFNPYYNFQPSPAFSNLFNSFQLLSILLVVLRPLC